MKAKNNEIGEGGGVMQSFFSRNFRDCQHISMQIWQCMIHNGTLKSFVGSNMNYISMSKIMKKIALFLSKSDLRISTAGKHSET